MPPQSASDQALARDLIHSVRSAALATLGEDGAPFASYVITAPAANGSPLLLLSKLALHTSNLQRDPRASLLLVREAAAEAETMTAIRLTLTGRVLAESDPEAGRAFLAVHPDAARYAGFADFAFYRFHLAAAHLVAGFGRIVALTPDEILGE